MNEPAFPVPIIYSEVKGLMQSGEQTGITIRDYFAAKAMQGMLAGGCKNVEVLAYIIADKMLKARKVTPLSP